MTDGRTPPRITKAKRVHGDTLIFRDAAVSDAEFILSLRTDVEKSRYLSQTDNDVAAQRAWLEHYATSEGQAYFIIEFNGEPIGTVRLYDARGGSFCWGSWILKEGRPRQAAMESALMVYAYALDHLQFDACHFDVRKGNDRVIKFHERFGAIRTGETELDFLFKIDRTSIQAARAKYTEFLSAGVTVSGLEPNS
ncbi:MAG: GNAT family N-acetyltransferase [Proteobacteria bacterium]|jgi:Acetyltransferases, including N-acetylases of ribosomal proteins|nr:GNAT family N-acetyltransferase [Pseudomonadota bacterium]